MASAAPVVAVSAGVLCPFPSRRATEGLAKQQHADRRRDDEREDGAEAPRHAFQERGLVPGGPLLRQVGRHHRHHGDGDDAIGQLEEGVGVGVRRHRVGAGHAAGQDRDDEERDLVGQHEPEGPPAQAGHGAQRLVAWVPTPAQQAEVGAAEARDQRHALEHDAERGAEPEEDELRVVLLHPGQRGAVAGPEPEPHEDPDADEVVDDRRPGDGNEPTARVEQCGARARRGRRRRSGSRTSAGTPWRPGARGRRGGSGRRPNAYRAR